MTMQQSRLQVAGEKSQDGNADYDQNDCTENLGNNHIEGDEKCADLSNFWKLVESVKLDKTVHNYCNLVDNS